MSLSLSHEIDERLQATAATACGWSPLRAGRTVKSGERPAKYLALYLGTEEYGIDVVKVREIIGIQNVTTVPHTPNYIKGIINLRGNVIPVIDLRLKLGLVEREHTHSTCIIVVQSGSGLRSSLTGLVVDGVSEVLAAAASEIEPPPTFGRDMPMSYLLGIAKTQGKVKLLLDIDRVLATEDSNWSKATDQKSNT